MMRPVLDLVLMHELILSCILIRIGELLLGLNLELWSVATPPSSALSTPSPTTSSNYAEI